MKKLRYALEAVLLYTSFFIFRLMPLEWASNTGGTIARFFGPKLAASRKAMTNVKSAIPGKGKDEYETIIANMWENLGRVFAEYPHLDTLARDKTEFIGAENINRNEPCIFFGGHIANWELIPSSLFLQQKLATASLYRAPNNPWADRLLHKCRTLNGRLHTIPKSKSGTRQWLETMQNGQSVALLIDQKYNEGMSVSFFGMEAMTGTAFIQMAQKFNVPLHPIRVERLESANFRVSVYPALVTEGRDIEDIIKEAHALLEDWIKDKPGQWLWLHRRWDSKALNNASKATSD